MSKTGWVLFSIMALVLAGAAAAWREANPAWASWQARYDAEAGVTPIAGGIRALTPTRTGQPELCVTCHVGIEDISPSHPAQVFGCIVCHGGDPLALDATRAHAGLRGGRNPSDLSVAEKNCGQSGCHGGYADEELNHVDRVLKSLQATYAGGIATLRYTFGLQTSPVAQFGLHAVQDTFAQLPDKGLPSLSVFMPVSGTVEAKFEQACASGGCHLGSPAPLQPYYMRSTGCAACHYQYADDGLYRGQDPTISKDERGHGMIHRLTTAISYTQCDHCHNRGNYSLKRMEFLPRDDLPPLGPAIGDTMPPEGRRLKEYYQPMTQYTKCEVELNCVDCHTAQEVMGNGHIYGSKKDSQYIRCQTCHGTPTTLPSTAIIQKPDDLAMRQARINGHADFLKVGDALIQTARGEMLWAIKQFSPGQFVQLDKVTGKEYQVPLVKGSKCTQNGQDQSSQYCHQCHSVAQ